MGTYRLQCGSGIRKTLKLRRFKQRKEPDFPAIILFRYSDAEPKAEDENDDENEDDFGRKEAMFFDDARGSAFESAACLDASVAHLFVSVDRVDPGKEMLARRVAMLLRLV